MFLSRLQYLIFEIGCFVIAKLGQDVDHLVKIVRFALLHGQVRVGAGHKLQLIDTAG